MIRNYLKITFANLRKNKAYSIISISSLSIGMAVCMLLLLYVSLELSYDRYHKKADNIYRLCQEVHPYQAPQVAKLLADNLPEIKDYTRILAREDVIVQYDEQRFKEDEVAYVDADLFNIFSFKFTKGDARTALVQPATIVISETIAQKYFGDENPIDKILTLNNEVDYTVTGVIEDLAQNSHFRYDIFATLADANTIYGEASMNSWGWLNFLVYFEMEDHFSKPELESKIIQIIAEAQQADQDSPPAKYTVQQLKDIHLHSSNFLGDIQPQNSITYVMIFSAIGLLILLIACFNYVNLLTANATTRVTEIAVRKSYGASRKQLAIQFISESFIVFVISFSLSLVIVWFCLPIFNELSGKALSFSILTKVNIIFGVLGMMLIISVLAGWYPAFILSSFNPTKVLKASKKSGSKFQVKKLPVGAQFTIVIILIASSIIMFRQINFLQKKDLGFNKDHVMVSVVEFGDGEGYNTLKDALQDLSFVSSVSQASRVPSGSLGNQGGILPEGQTEYHTIPFVHINFDYFKTLGISTAQGRLFSDQLMTDATQSIILNETAVTSLGIQGNPIGQTLQCSWPTSERKIVGVINDIHFETLYEKIKPTVFVIYPEACYKLMIKMDSYDKTSSLQSITEICQDIYPDEIFDFFFLDDQLEQRYQSDINTFHLMGFFAALAIVLASMGLLGMASFIMVSRTKEIGIRKVSGATVSEIMKMLNMSFIKWIAVAFVIASPIVYYAMTRWLESFAFRTSLSWWIFALSGIISLGIVLLTVSWLSYRAAHRNPIESLKYE